MDCVVTGGAGFIGSNLVDALVDRGDRVTVIDNLSTGKRENLERALARGAVAARSWTSRDAVRRHRRVRARRGPRSSFHLAAQIDVRYSVEHPAGDANFNVLGTIAVLEAARAAGTRRIVQQLDRRRAVRRCRRCYRRPRTTRSGRSPRTARASTPLRATAGCTHRLHDLSTVSLRYGNVYGPRQDVHGEAGVVAIFCGHLIDGTAPTSTATATRRGTGSRWSDVVRANLLAAGQRRDRPDQHRLGPRDLGQRPARGAARRRPERARCPSRATSPSARARSGAAVST